MVRTQEAEATVVKAPMIVLKTSREIQTMREANRIVAEILERLAEMIKPGATTGELDKVAEAMIRQAKGKAALRGTRCATTSPTPR